MATPKNITEHITLWVRWRWFIIGVVASTAILSLIISLIIPKTYRSTSVVLPPFEGGGALPFLEGLSIDIFGSNEVPSAALILLLKSRALKDQVNIRIDLREHYEEEDLELAYLAFEDHLEIELETEESFGMVSVIAVGVSVLDKDPEFCAKLVNVVVDEWRKLFLDINRRGASLRRRFLEENLFDIGANLAAAEDSLRRFQEEQGIAAFSEQVEGTIASAIELEQQVINVRIVVKVLEKLFQPNHPELKRVRMEYEELQKQLHKLKTPSDDESLLFPLGLAPEIGLQYARLLRRVKTNEAISTILVQQYEQAKLQELKDTPSIRIVDRGAVPTNKYRPRRLMLILIATFGSLMLIFPIIYFLDYTERVKGTEDSHWMEEIQSLLKDDVKKIRFRKIT